MATIQPAVDEFSTTKDVLDAVDAPAMQGGQNLTDTGRILALAEANKDSERKLTQAKVDLALLRSQVGGSPMVNAKALLAESFKWLEAFEATVELRQRIKLFLEAK